MKNLLMSGVWLVWAAAICVSAEPALQKRADITDCLTTANVPQFLSQSTNFTQEAKPFNLRLPFTPVAIAVPTAASQVQAAVSCAASLKVKVSAKGGGHSYASHGIGGEDGHLIVDLKYMNNVTVDATSKIATIGTGARLGNVALALFDQGSRAISHGTCPGVGIGGHVLGGGYGYASHTYGLALDNLVEATVVLANASIVTASKTQNPDLFWALRGAGPSFGIVTSYKFQTFEAPSNNTIFSYSLSLNQTQARTTFEALQNYTNTSMPAEMNLRLLANSYSTTLMGVYYGSQANFTKAIQPLIDSLPKVGTPSLSSKGWIDTLSQYAYASMKQPLDYDVHETFFAKSMMTNTVSPKAMDAFVDYWYTTAKKVTRSWYIIIDAHGGPTSAISRVPKSDTSYAHRKALFKYELYDAVLGFGGGSSYPANGFDFLNGWVASVANNTAEPIGYYFNYADTSLTTEKAYSQYWLDSYPRLSKIKTAVDPKNVFSNPQAVVGS